MNDQTWLELFDATNHTFKWFFTKYGYTKSWDELISLRHSLDRANMFSIMNDIWFHLPDGHFNIMKNPPGWSNFLRLLEAGHDEKV